MEDTDGVGATRQIRVLDPLEDLTLYPSTLR
jgi:hypothetical protein